MVDYIYLTYPDQFFGKIKKRTAVRQPHMGRTSILDVIVVLKPCRIFAYSGFSGSLFHVLPILNEELSGEKKKESIIRVRMG